MASFNTRRAPGPELTVAVLRARPPRPAQAKRAEIIGVVVPESYGASVMMGGLSSVTLRADIECCVQEGLNAVVAGLDLMLAGSRGFGPLPSVLVGGVSAG